MNLTTLQNLKSWLSVTSTTDDALMSRLIIQISGMIYAYLQRSSFIMQNYTDYRNGNGNCSMLLDNWPVLSVSSVQVGSLTVPAAPPGINMCQAGWFLNPWSGFPPGRAQSVNLRGYFYSSGNGNVAISYVAGYAVQNEAWTVPVGTPPAITPNSPYGSWAADNGVAYANGIKLVAVASNPTIGQYVPPTYGGAQSWYSFNVADEGANILITYSYIPAPIEQACIEVCSERYKYKSRIGNKSQSVAGQETVSYDLSGFPDAVKEMLGPYMDMTQDFSV